MYRRLKRKAVIKYQRWICESRQLGMDDEEDLTKPMQTCLEVKKNYLRLMMQRDNNFMNHIHVMANEIYKTSGRQSNLTYASTCHSSQRPWHVRGMANRAIPIICHRTGLTSIIGTRPISACFSPSPLLPPSPPPRTQSFRLALWMGDVQRPRRIPISSEHIFNE